MIPTLFTKRLILRPYILSDAERVETLASDRQVAEMTAAIPHPYPEGLAVTWISRHEEKAAEKGSYTFAVVLKSTEELVGTLTFRIDQEDHKAELGYWFGVPYWGNGYCTEAAERMVEYGFEEAGLNKVWAAAMTKNAASIKVIQKLGFEHEGTFKQDAFKFGVYENMEYYGLLKEQYKSN